jgi:hypothetical protein
MKSETFTTIMDNLPTEIGTAGLAQTFLSPTLIVVLGIVSLLVYLYVINSHSLIDQLNSRLIYG